MRRQSTMHADQRRNSESRRVYGTTFSVGSYAENVQNLQTTSKSSPSNKPHPPTRELARSGGFNFHLAIALGVVVVIIRTGAFATACNLQQLQTDNCVSLLSCFCDFDFGAFFAIHWTIFHPCLLGCFFCFHQYRQFLRLKG